MTLDLSTLDDGEVFEMDARIFHRCGVDGTHHIEDGLAVFLEPANHNPEEGDDERTILLTQAQRDALHASYVPLVDHLVVPADDPAATPTVAAIRRRGGDA